VSVSPREYVDVLTGMDVGLPIDVCVGALIDMCIGVPVGTFGVSFSVECLFVVKITSLNSHPVYIPPSSIAFHFSKQHGILFRTAVSPTFLDTQPSHELVAPVELGHTLVPRAVEVIRRQLGQGFCFC